MVPPLEHTGDYYAADARRIPSCEDCHPLFSSEPSPTLFRHTPSIYSSTPCKTQNDLKKKKLLCTKTCWYTTRNTRSTPSRQHTKTGHKNTTFNTRPRRKSKSDKISHFGERQILGNPHTTYIRRVCISLPIPRRRMGPRGRGLKKMGGGGGVK